MSAASDTAAVQLGRIWRFSRRVLANFIANRGVLLAGGVGYNVLLSIIPLFAVCAVVLSTLVEEQQLADTIRLWLELLAAGHTELVLDAVRPFLEGRQLIGTVGFLVLLFFSSLAFRMLEDAIAVIFHVRDDPRGRSRWFSALLPFAYVLVLGSALLLVTALVALVDGLGDRSFQLLGLHITASGISTIMVYALGFLGLGLLFTSIYKVLPVVHIALRRALVGGFVAAALWEGALRVMSYYFVHLSLVQTVYGPFATVVVILLGLEVASVILLLGAQVIAELERSAAAGVPWHQPPPRQRGR